MKKRVFILSLIIITSFKIMAQSDFRPGYVLSLNGDTVWGLIDYRSNIILSKECTFKPNNSDSLIHYSPYNIKEYRFKNSKYYVSKTIDNKSSFFEYLVNGKISLYYLSDAIAENYYINNDSLGTRKLPFTKTLFKKDVEYMKESTRHIGILKVYMHDAPEMQHDIEAIKVPTHDNLIKLVEKYNSIVCGENICLNYVKPKPKFAMSVELNAGGLQIEYKDQNVSSMAVSGIAHIWLPYVNEKLFFRTGLIASLNNDKSLVKVPLQFEYLYPKGKLRPRLSCGFNYYLNFAYLSNSLVAGLNYAISKKSDIVLNYEIEAQTNNYLLPTTYFSQGLYLGYQIKF